MNRKELNKTFMMITNCNKPFGLQGFSKKKLALQGLKTLWVGHVPTRILIFFFFLIFCVFYLFSCFKMFPKKYLKLNIGVGGFCLTNPSFSRIFGFSLT